MGGWSVPRSTEVGPNESGTVLFDLDGTLTNPERGITACIRYALERLGAPVPPAEDLLWCIGPPLRGSLASLLGDEAASEDALRLYRERFASVGLFENEVYEGVPDALAKLAESGYRLFVATSKPEVYARRIVEHFGLAGHFEGVYGSELDGARSDKEELIRHILKQEGIGADDALMVGDREHDMVGAAGAGVRGLGVTYGYGSEQELRGACAVCASPHDLPDCVRLAFARSGPARIH